MDLYNLVETLRRHLPNCNIESKENFIRISHGGRTYELKVRNNELILSDGLIDFLFSNGIVLVRAVIAWYIAFPVPGLCEEYQYYLIGGIDHKLNVRALPSDLLIYLPAYG